MGRARIGEQILFTSVFKDIINNFEKILLLIDDRLCRIFRENFPNIEVYPMSESVDENLFDYHLPICSLGKYFRKESSNFLNSKHNFLNVNENKFNDKDKNLDTYYLGKTRYRVFKINQMKIYYQYYRLRI